MGLCLDDRLNSSSPGSAVVRVWSCNGQATQQWQVMSDGTIRHNSLCLSAVGGGTANGTGIVLDTCTGTRRPERRDLPLGTNTEVTQVARSRGPRTAEGRPPVPDHAGRVQVPDSPTLTSPWAIW
jgi:hypothetical protein